VNISTIRKLHEEAGGYFFSPRAKRFFRSIIGRRVYTFRHGVYLFVTSETPDYDRPRRYTIRLFDEANPRSIETVGEFMAFDTSRAAYRVCEQIIEEVRRGDR